MRRQSVRAEGDSGEGNGGGFVGGFGRIPSQFERISTSIGAQIRGWFWATTFAIIALAIVFAIILAIGPDSVWFIGQAMIVAALIYGLRSLSGVPDEQMDLAKFLLVVYILFAIIASVVWWFAPITEYWPPIMHVESTWKLIVIIVFASVFLLYSGLMSFSFLAGAVNPASFPPYRPRNPAAGLFDWVRPTDKPEQPEYNDYEDGIEALTADDIAAMVAEAIDKKPLVQRRTVFVNGQHKHTTGEVGDNANA